MQIEGGGRMNKYQEALGFLKENAREIPLFFENRIHEVIADEIEARKIMLADLGDE